MEALHKAHREDLIGHDPKCLIRPESKAARAASSVVKKGPAYKRNAEKPTVNMPMANRKSTEKRADNSRAPKSFADMKKRKKK